MSHWELIGDCTDSFDENGECLIGLFSDVSDFACSEENAIPVAIELDALPKLEVPQFDALIFSLDESKGVLFGYDEQCDVHYFFRQIAPCHVPA